MSKHGACTCHEFPAHNDPLEIATRGLDKVVGTRLNNAAARELVRYCSKNRCTQSEAIRAALSMLRDGPAAKTREELAKLLGAEPDATDDEIMGAVRELLERAPIDVPPTGGEPSAEAPDPPPPLSAATLKAIAAKGLTVAEYRSRMATAVRRAR